MRPLIILGQDEQGSAVLVGLGLAIVLVVAGIASLDVGVLAAARAKAQTAADLAALAALTPGAETSAGRASLIASANGAELAACACTTREALVTVRLAVALPPAVAGVTLTARARAVLPSLTLRRRGRLGRRTQIGRQARDRPAAHPRR